MNSESIVLPERNPYIIDLHRLGKIALFILLAVILLSLVLKIILDLRKYHYKD